ncbi:hypothetical protein KQH40_00590 [bacterium]|nr:hypothetical protein [bacterium]
MNAKKYELEWTDIYDIESGSQKRVSRRPSMGRPGNPVAKVTRSYKLSFDESRILDEVSHKTNLATTFTVTKSQIVGFAIRLLKFQMEAMLKEGYRFHTWTELASALFINSAKASTYPWAQLYEAESGKNPQTKRRSSAGRPRSSIKKVKRTFSLQTDEVKIIEETNALVDQQLPFNVTYSQVVALAIRNLEHCQKKAQLPLTPSSWKDLAQPVYEAAEKEDHA